MDIFKSKSRDYLVSSAIEWVVWMIGSVCAVWFIQWCSVQYGAPTYDFHIWLSATLYLWYVSTMSLVVGSVYFIARMAQTQLERRQNHPQKPESVNLEDDIKRVKNIKQRSFIFALILHSASAAFVYYVSRHIPGITQEFRIYAVVGVFGVAAIKPAFNAINTLRVEIWGMLAEADYPAKTVAELWVVVNKFGDYEERLKTVFEKIGEAKEGHSGEIKEALAKLTEDTAELSKTLKETFDEKVGKFQESDDVRQKSYNELKEAQSSVTSEAAKILEAIQTLQKKVMDLRENNIKGEEIMAALKILGINELSELNVTLTKHFDNTNPNMS